MAETNGASAHERLIAAARTDNEELIQEVFEEGNFDVNYQDGLGNTALHYAAAHGSLTVLEHILSHEECDVDPINRLEKATPLHLALKLEDPEERVEVFRSLLDAGADTTIKNKEGDTVLDLIPAEDTEIRSLIRSARAAAALSKEDVASDEFPDDEGPGSGSGSDDD